MSIVKGFLETSFSELSSPERYRQRAQLGHAILFPSTTLIWMVASFLHSSTAYVPNLTPVHIICTLFLAQIIAFALLARTRHFSLAVYAFNLFIDVVLIFAFIAFTGINSSPFLFLPLLYLIGSLFVHGFFLTLFILFLEVIGYGAPIIAGVQEPNFAIIMIMLILALLVIIFTPIWFLHTTELRIAEKALQESERRYRELAELLPQTLFEIDLAGKLTYVNRTGLAIFGYSKEDIDEGLNAFELFIPEDRERVRTNIQHYLAGSSPKGNEYSIIGKNGRLSPVIIYSSVITREETPVGLRGIVLDITDRKLAEEKMRESEEKFRNLAEAALDAIILMDHDGKISYWNQGAEKIFGYRRTEVLDKNLQDFLIPKSLAPDFMKSLAFFIEARETARGKIRELTTLRKDGTEVSVEPLISPLKIKDQWGAIGILRDITERKKALESINKLSRQNELILNSLGEGIYGVDLEGKATFVNPAMIKMVGYTTEELIGRSMHGLIHHSREDGSPYPDKECPIYAAYRDGSVHRESHDVFWRKDGTSFLVDYVSTPIREDGQIVGAVVVFRNITEQKMLEEQLLQIRIERERMDTLRTLTMTYSHNILNAITPIQGFAQLIMKHVDRDDPKFMWAESIVTSTKKTSELVHKLRKLESLKSTQLGGFKIFDIDEDAEKNED